MSVLKVSSCSAKAARYAVEHWHYSKRVPVGSLVRFGVWEDGQFIGAVIFSRGGSDKLGSPYGLDQIEVCELARVAMREHEVPVSQVVAICMRALHNLSPGLRLCVSFADPFRGHHGGIYQAGNWIYTGMTTPDPVWITRGGQVLFSRSVSTRQFGRRGPGVPAGATKSWRPGKHRYLYPFDRAMRRQIARISKAYPTRGSGLEGETAAVQADGPGSIPGNRSKPVAL